jgi:MFS family permease
MVLLGLGLNVIGMLGMAAGRSVLVLLIARLVMGLGAGAATPAVRRIVINADPDNLGRNLGTLLAADVAGFAAGPAISAVMVGPLGIPAPFLLIGALSAVAIPVVLRLEVAEALGAAPDEPRLAFDLLRSRPVVAGLLCGAAVFMMIGTFDALWVLVLDDLGASDVIANLGIIVFALPLVLFGSYGGRLAERVGPFRLAPLGLLLGVGYMFLYGVMPTGETMLAVGVAHALCDGFTVSSTAVAIGMVAPRHRQASAQGMLGAAETLTAGITAALTGVLYSAGGRLLAYGVCSVTMLALIVGAWVLAGPEARALRGGHPSLADTDPALV